MEQEQSDSLVDSYRRFVPHEFLNLLGKNKITDVKLGDQKEKAMTILFSDIRDFTSLSESITPQQNFNFLNSYLSEMEPIIGANNGVIDKYIGDAIMALFPYSADDAVKCAIDMTEKLRHYNAGRKRAGYMPVNIGISLNTGLMMLGTVGGKSRMDGTVVGDAVNLASRIESMTKEYGTEVLISEHTLFSVSNEIGDNIRFIDRVKIRGKKRHQSVYELFSGDIPDVKEKKLATKELFEKALAHYHFKQIKKAKELLSLCLSKFPDDKPVKVYLERCENFRQNGSSEESIEIDLLMDWEKSLEIGYSIIDEQHKNIYEQVNELVKAIKENNFRRIEDKFNLLATYAREHFEEEEECMIDHAYPFYDTQKGLHDRFLYYVGKIQEDIQDLDNKYLSVLFHIQIFIIDWLINHITGIDRHLGRYLSFNSSST